MSPANPSFSRFLPPSAGALALVALVLSACATLPPRGQVLMRDVSFPLRDFRLPSGLRVVVEEDRRAPVVAVVALVGTGASADPSGKEGLAHVVEHLTFRARHGGGASVWTRLEQLGAGRFNASTRLDHTTYESLAPREALPELLRLEAQRLAAPLEGITPEVFAVEREVVRNELREGNETGYVGQLLPWVQQVSFPSGHPYARPIIGSHDSLSALSLADAHRFVRQAYQPDNVTLVITGDVDLQGMEALLEASLPEAWRGGGPPLAMSTRLPQPAPAPPLAPAAPKLVVREAAVSSPELYLTWTLPRGFDEASAVQDFVRASLSYQLGHAWGRDGDITSIRTGLISGTRASLLVVRVTLNKGEDPERSAEAVLDQVYRVWSSENGAAEVLASDWDFQRMRRSVIVGLALETEDVLARAVRRAELTHFSLDVRAYGRSQAALVGLDASRMTDFAYQWLRRDRARLLLVRPGKNGVPALATLTGLAPEEEAPLSSAGSLPVGLAAPPPVTSMRLENGLEVLLVPRPGLPLVTVGVALGGGEVSGQRRGVAELADFVSFRKSVFHGNAADFGLHGSSLLYRDHLRYELAGAAGNVGNMVAILGDQLSSMGTTSEAMNFYTENVLPVRKAVDARPDVRAERALLRALYGEHPYGQAVTAEDLERVTQGEVEDWLDVVHRPSNAVVVIAGEFEPQQVEPLVRKHLGRWGTRGPAVEVPPAPPLPSPNSQPVRLITPRPGATQGHVQLACRLPEGTPEAAARYSLMAEVTRSRLWRQVRERMGATYGFHSRVSMTRGGASHLLVEGVVDTPRMGDALVTARSALVTYAQEGVSEAELERARVRLLARHAVSLTTSEDWVEALLNVRVLGWDAASVSRRPELLRAVTAAELKREFAGCAERLVVGVTGDEEAARTATLTAFP